MDFWQFRQNMSSTFGLNLEDYKENQMRRRLDSYLIRKKLANYQELFFKLKKTPDAYEEFLDFLTINVSEFFRDPARWAELEKTILPELLAGKQALKIWSAACANGAEAYSIAIILNERTPFCKHRIMATDIDQKVLNCAWQGVYSPEAVRHVSKERLNKYFSQRENNFLINDEIRKMVSFHRHDLLAQIFENGFDLIFCRNVSIYFTRAAQDQLNYKLSGALTKGGYLFIGGSEMIFNYKELGLERISASFYRKEKTL